MPFTDFRDMKETDTGGLLVLATVQIPALNLDVKTMVHGVPGLTIRTIGRFFVLDLIPRVACGYLCDSMTHGAVNIAPGETHYLNATPYATAVSRFKESSCCMKMEADSILSSGIGLSHYKNSRFEDGLGWLQLAYLYAFFTGINKTRASAAYNVAMCFHRMGKDRHALMWAKRVLEIDANHAKAEDLRQACIRTVPL
jgi:hypothetical protein